MRAFALFLTLGLSLATVVVQANSLNSEIESICKVSKKLSSPTLLGAKIDKLIADYSQITQRRLDPRGLLAALDEVVALTSYSSLLNCRGSNYDVHFMENTKGGMSVSYPYRGNNKVVMNFNIAMSVESALFTYVHELTHVCQYRDGTHQKLDEKIFEEDDKISRVDSAIFFGYTRSAFPPGTLKPSLRAIDLAYGESIINQVVGEVEASRNQLGSFIDLIKSSNKLCERSELLTKASSPLYFIYLRLERALQKGFFAQMFANIYQDHYTHGDRYWYVFGSKKVRYSFEDLKHLENAEDFKVFKLSPRLIEEVQKLGVKVIEPL